jgi:hypothetical protein
MTNLSLETVFVVLPVTVNKRNITMDFTPEIIRELLAQGQFVLMAAIIIFTLLIKHDPFKIIIHQFEKPDKDIDRNLQLLQSDRLTPQHNQFLIDHIEQFNFFKISKIVANREFREFLIDFQAKNARFITWKDLRRARSLYEFNGHTIEIKIKESDILSKWFINILSGGVGGLGVVLALSMVTLNLFEPQKPSQIAASTILGYSFIMASFIFYSSNWKYESAEKLKKVLAAECPQADYNIAQDSGSECNTTENAPLINKEKCKIAAN